MHIQSDLLKTQGGNPVPFIETPNKSGKLVGGKPKFIVVHYTATGTATSAINWFQKSNAKASAHLVVDHDGAITQMAKFNEKCWHAGISAWNGISGLNAHAVGIEIANWGLLSGTQGNRKSWTGKSVDESRVIMARHKNRSSLQAWEQFDEAQFEAVISIVQALMEAYDLDTSKIIGHDDISPSRKVDPGPAWDMERFRERCGGREADDGDIINIYKTSAKNGLNMRKGPGVEFEKIATLPFETNLIRLDTDGQWWLVAQIKNKEPDETGWVHSNWVKHA